MKEIIHVVSHLTWLRCVDNFLGTTQHKQILRGWCDANNEQRLIQQR